MHIDAAIFDLDGTLVNLNIPLQTMTKELHKIDPNIQQPILTNVFKSASRDELLRKITLFELKAAIASKPIENAITLVRELWCRGFPLGIVTFQSLPTVITVFTRFKLLDCFSVVIARGTEPITRAQQLRKACDLLSVPPTKTVFVGDLQSDKDAANEIGCLYCWPITKLRSFID